MDFAFEDYIEPELRKYHIPYIQKGKLNIIKLRFCTFNKLFKYKDEISLIETTGMIDTGYLDYIQIKINLRTSILRLIAVFLRKDNETGNILGDDNIPSDARSY